jgi:hypothetical protein
MFENAIRKYDKIADYLESTDEIIKSIPNDAKKIDEIAKKLEIRLEGQLEPATPLARTPAEAIMEQKTKFKTKAIILAREIRKKCQGMK